MAYVRKTKSGKILTGRGTPCLREEGNNGAQIEMRHQRKETDGRWEASERSIAHEKLREALQIALSMTGKEGGRRGGGPTST